MNNCGRFFCHFPFFSGVKVMFIQVSETSIRLVLLVLVALAVGCSGGSSVESFHPQRDAALDALTSALTAWQNGETMDDLSENTDPEVKVAEPKWNAGSKLKSFEIVQALPGDMPRKF